MRLWHLLLLPFVLMHSSQVFSQKLETVVQKGHNAAVKAVAVSRDGKFLATGSRDKTAKLWDISSGREIRTYLGAEQTVNGVQFSPDFTMLASTSSDGSARVWDVRTGS